MHDQFKTASGVQSSGPWDPWQPVLENSQLFAQHGHSAWRALQYFPCERPCGTRAGVRTPGNRMEQGGGASASAPSPPACPPVAAWSPAAQQRGPLSPRSAPERHTYLRPSDPRSMSELQLRHLRLDMLRHMPLNQWSLESRVRQRVNRTQTRE